jgi:hypothetical protein
MAALSLEVIIPTFLGRMGMGFFLSWLNRPSASSFSLRRFSFREEMPFPIGKTGVYKMLTHLNLCILLFCRV